MKPYTLPNIKIALLKYTESITAQVSVFTEEVFCAPKWLLSISANRTWQLQLIILEFLSILGKDNKNHVNNFFCCYNYNMRNHSMYYIFQDLCAAWRLRHLCTKDNSFKS